MEESFQQLEKAATLLMERYRVLKTENSRLAFEVAELRQQKELLTDKVNKATALVEHWVRDLEKTQ